MLELLVIMIVNVFWSLFPILEDGGDHNYPFFRMLALLQ